MRFKDDERSILKINEHIRIIGIPTAAHEYHVNGRTPLEWFIDHYHYLGYKTLVGAQMRYAVHDRNGWALAMLGFSTAAWKLAPRDHFIGWTPRVRENNLPLVVDNPRFLILPWITIPNLGSHILAIVRRRLPQDWTERYHTTPVLIEALALDCFSILRNSSLLGKVMKIRHLLELGIFLPVPLRRARWT